MTEPLKKPMGLKIYRAASRAAEPVANFALNRRLKAGKEDETRIDERRGVAGRPRPDGRLIWIHGASVGESLSVLPLVKRLSVNRPDTFFLVTTGTVTSAKLMSERLPENAFHQYAPLDHPEFVRIFLEHWRPDAALFVESEFWPNLIIAARDATPYMALINGRVSPKSYADWKSQPNAIKYLLSSFDLILAQDHQNAERLTALADKQINTFGNLKHASAPLPVDENELTRLREALSERPSWLAASTHPGEEDIAIAVHKSLAAEFPGLVTFIAPRHPDRGADIAEAAAAQGLRVARRSETQALTGETDIYIADTLGELGIFYRLTDIAFIGGSINPKGGHNPLEPARLGGAVLHGPQTFNFADTYRDLRKAGGAALVRNDQELSHAVRRLLNDQRTRRAMVDAARNAAETNAERVLNDICDAITSRMPETTVPS
ncbi:MAG: 3-deoxy-D-manno-octulosonic acid transferase [Pseudomonadota bacterium]